MSSAKIYYPKSVQFDAKRLAMSTWVDHMPFGYDLVAELRPSKIVELGSHNAISYFTFCQSVIENDIDALCYAVDTWEGDEHSGSYGEEVFEAVRAHAREHYRGISYLMRMLFDDALAHFDDESIDLLHIDGLHTFEAVKHDFDTWLPKVRPGGIVLFHDIEARMEDFGVWKYWQELERDYQTFAFPFGFGLGVLHKPGGDLPEGELFDIMFNGSEADHSKLRRMYTTLGHYHQVQRQLRRLQKK